MITFNTRHQVWSSTPSINKHKIAIHELFHIFQGQNQFLNGNPRWFIEGGAEFVGYQGVSYGSLLSYNTARRCQLFSMAFSVPQSLTLKDGGIPPNGGYWLAFMGIDYMANSEPRTFARVVNHLAPAWDAKLAGTLGLSADQFFDRFEAERRQYQIPSSYECPT